MPEHCTLSRRKAVIAGTSAVFGGIGLWAYSDSASATLQADPTYSVQNATREISGELEAVRLVVDADIQYQADEEITTLGATLDVAQQGSELETLDTSIIQQNSQESTLTKTLRANLSEILQLSELQESTTDFVSELYVFIEASGERVAETTIPETFTITMEDGKIDSTLGVTAEGSIEVSESG